jgi:hypothetical protein
MRTKNLLIYESIWDMIPKLSDNQIACLFRGIADWRLGNTPVFDDPLVQGIWFGIEPNLNSLEESYNKKVTANKENGKLGGRPKKTEHNPNNPSGFLETQHNPNNLKEKEKDKEKEKEKDKDIDKELYAKNKSSIHYIMDSMNCSLDEAMDIFYSTDEYHI